MLRRLVLVGWLVFGVGFVALPTTAYAISLDDEEEDAEDVADLLEQTKSAGKSESFDEAQTLLQKAKMYGVESEDTQETGNYVAQMKKERDERLERERQAKLEAERQAKLEAERRERESSQSSGGYYSGSDMKNMCLGASGAYKTFCYNVGNSDLKNTCLGMTDYPIFCYKVQDSDMKNFCLATSGQYPTFCYNIGNSDLKNSCLGITQSSNNCYNVQDGNMKSMCMGIANTSNNCYNIR